MKTTINPIRLTVAILISFFLFACNSARKAQRQLGKIDMNHPGIFTDYVHKYYPAIVKPISKDTTNRPDGSVQRTIDSLTAQTTKYKAAAKYALKRADSAIIASLTNRDTGCAKLLIGLKRTITDSRDRIDNLLHSLSTLQIAYNHLRDNPLTITETVSVLDSATVTNLRLQNTNYANQLAGKEGEIKQLTKTNRKKNITIAVMGLIIAGGIFFKLKG